jgi:hypothetical protein
MIELTEHQVTALDTAQGDRPRVVNPRSTETFVVLRAGEFERLKESEYDDSPGTRDELQALAWTAGEQTAWEAYDDAAAKPLSSLFGRSTFS